MEQTLLAIAVVISIIFFVFRLKQDNKNNKLDKSSNNNILFNEIPNFMGNAIYEHINVFGSNLGLNSQEKSGEWKVIFAMEIAISSIALRECSFEKIEAAWILEEIISKLLLIDVQGEQLLGGDIKGNYIEICDLSAKLSNDFIMAYDGIPIADENNIMDDEGRRIINELRTHRILSSVRPMIEDAIKQLMVLNLPSSKGALPEMKYNNRLIKLANSKN